MYKNSHISSFLFSVRQPEGASWKQNSFRLRKLAQLMTNSCLPCDSDTHTLTNTCFFKNTGLFVWSFVIHITAMFRTDSS